MATHPPHTQVDPDPKQWPTVEGLVIEDALKNRGTATAVSVSVTRLDGAYEVIDRSEYARGAAAMLAAFKRHHDDPAADPIGIVRRSPEGVAYMAHEADADSNYRWFLCNGSLRGPATYRSNAQVRGWPIIGAVPGTPAAEAVAR